MFKTAARKLAHNSTLPSLGGKQDLRALQDLIIQEKTVLSSLQRVSVEFGRSADHLRVWGQGEGDDLGDTLSASAALLQLFSAAVNTLADHELKIRDLMKTVRTREENLDEVKRRRKSVFSDAEGAERKLSKMNSENKNLQQQKDLLNRLREEIRSMDAEIMSEEASLGDFKRASVREWMGLRFGGLLECCEKGRIVGEMGKLVISEIPMETTQPGFPRAYYTGHSRTGYLVAEAQRSVSEVVFSMDPNQDPSQRSIFPLPGAEPPATQLPMPMGSMNGNSLLQRPGVGSQLSYATSTASPYPGLPEVEETGFSVSPFLSDVPNMSPSVNEFGTFSSPPSNQPSSFGVAERDKLASPRGGRFATFPVKAIGPRPLPGGAQQSGGTISTNPYLTSPSLIRDDDRPPSLGGVDRENGESFSSSVVNALGRFSIEDSPSGSSSRAPQLPPQDVKSGADFGPQRYSPPPPLYTPSEKQSLPAGAASPNPPTGLYGHENLEAPTGGTDGPSSRPHSAHAEDEGLAYMASGRGNESNESVSDSSDRRVRFGGVTDVNQALLQREEKRRARVPVPPLEEVRDLQEDHLNGQNGRHSPEVHRSQPASPTYSDPVSRGRSPTSAPLQARAPTPPAPDALMDERALNAAAAREVSRELDALMGSPPHALQDLPPPSPFSTGGASPYQTRSVSPLPPQSNTPYQPPSVSSLPVLNTSAQYSGPQSQSSPQTMSPRLEGTYVRHRDRSASSTAVRTPVQPVQEIAPIPPPSSSPAVSDDSDQRLSINISRKSPAPSTDTNGTPFRTPMSTPSGMPGSGSLYNLPGTAGSNTSFSAQSAAPRMISAAAFRRPQPQPRTMSGDSSMPDTTPLNVKKRVPPSPYPSPYHSPVPQSMPMLQPGPAYNAGMRSVSAPRMSAGLGSLPSEQDRPVTHYRQDGEDEDFDFSAYTDGPDRASGYGFNTGRHATTQENSESIR